MRIMRLGEYLKERPAVQVSDTEAVFVDHIIKDWNREELSADGLKSVEAADIKSLPRVKISDFRIGSPMARPTKLICIGLNYAKHAAESNMDIPKEPVVFMKAPDALVGPNDDVRIPKNSVKTDYEVELSIVIGKRALYIESEKQARDYVLGFAISQDISEREWQTERGGQWVKGKSFPTFNPMGPVVVTKDEFDPSDANLWTKVDGQYRQNSSTKDLIFHVDHIVWYVSQCMELFPGDIINTGTPEGVAAGMKPPAFLRAGQHLTTGIAGLGEQSSRVIAYNA
jgi:2-keto-4-pentenoate hydratase/2-oxohepta-3-ene-1,7-dioic acid hydratase in catechol pathway